MEKDQRDLLREFNAQRVRYLVIGGYAFSHYTRPRATKGSSTSSSTPARRMQPASTPHWPTLALSGGRNCQGFSQSIFQVGLPPSRIDILQAIEGIDFAAAWSASVNGMTGDDIPVRYISVEDLIRNKLALGRRRDLADVEELQKSEAANSKPPSPRPVLIGLFTIGVELAECPIHRASFHRIRHSPTRRDIVVSP